MVLGQLAVGLSLVFFFWAYTFCVGSCVLLNFRFESEQPPEPFDATDVLVSTCVGFALLIFLLITVAAAHAFFAPVIFASLVLLLVITALTASRRVGGTSILASYRSAASSCLNPPWFTILIICVILSAPALLPYNSSDDTLYHFADAINWSNTGSLVVDPFLRFPLAQFNVEILYALFFAFHLNAYVQFVTWIFFAITATGIVAFAYRLIREAGAPSALAALVALVTSAMFVLLPIALRYSVIGLIDIPAGAMLLALGAAATRSQKNYPRYGIAMAIIGGSFAGMKLTFAPFVIVAIVLVYVVGFTQNVSKKKILAICTLAVIVASPWYLRNIIVAGDPVDPVINLAMHHSDPFWTQSDFDAQKAELHVNVPVLFAPIWVFLNPQQAVGSVSLSYCLLYLPFVLFGVLLCSKTLRTRWRSLFLIDLILVAAISQEMIVSNRVARYSLHFYGLYTIFLCLATWMFINALASRLPPKLAYSGRLLSAFVLAVLIIPKETAEYGDFREAYTRLYFGVKYPTAVLTQVEGYWESQELSRLIVASGTQSRVLEFDLENLAYYFREHGITSMGDYWGPGSFNVFKDAVANGTFTKKLSEMDIGAVLIRKNGNLFTPDVRGNIIRSLLGAGFTEISRPDSEDRDFVRANILKLAAANGVVIQADEGIVSGDISFVDKFGYGRIAHDSSTSFVPGGLTAFILPVLFRNEYSRSLTILGGYNITFDSILINGNSKITFDVAKLFAFGDPAHAWVEIKGRSGTRRIFDAMIPKASDDGPLWQSESLQLHEGDAAVSLVFGVSGGEWVAFVHPKISDARFVDLEGFPTI